MNASRQGSKWLIVLLLWVVALLNYLDRQVIFSLFPLLRTNLGLTNIQLGLIGTSFLWVYAIVSPFSGFVADRFGRERIIIASLVVWSALTLVTGLVHSVSSLLLTRSLMGVSEACYLPAALALISERHSNETRSLATGVHQSGIYFGAAFGGGIGGWMGQHYGWKDTFLLLGAVGILYAGVLIWGLKTLGPDLRTVADVPKPQLRASFAETLQLRGFRIMTAVFALASVAGWMLYTWLPLYVYDRFHTSLTEAGFTGTFYLHGGSLVGILSGGWIADRWSTRSPSGRLFTQALGFLASAPFLVLVARTSSITVFGIGLVAFGLGRGFYDCNIMPLLCQIAPQNVRATGYGIFNFVGNIVGGATAVGAGALKNSMGLSAAIQIGAVIWLSSGALLLVAWHKGLFTSQHSGEVECKL